MRKLDLDFEDNAIYNLNKLSEQVNRRIDNFESARDERNFLLAGTSLGEIGRIAVWGSE